MIKEKKGDGGWSVTRLLIVILAVLVLVLIIYGLTDGVIKKYIAGADWNKLERINKNLESLMEKTKKIKVISDSGTNIKMKLCGRPIIVDMGKLDKGKPTDLLPPATLSVAPDEDSVDGTLIVDWSVVPPIGKLNGPLEILFEKGKIKKISGEGEEKILLEFIKDLKDPMMHFFSHITIGTNPSMKKLTGELMNDERKAGTVTIGVGSNTGAFCGEINAKSHIDFVLKKASVYFDNNIVVKNGKLTI